MKWFKKSFNSISMRLFAVMILLMAFIVLFVYLLQVILLPTYYQNQVFKRVEQTADLLAKPLNDASDANAFNEISWRSREFNQCIYVFNQDAILIYEANSMGSSCYLAYLIKPNFASYQNENVIIKQYIQKIRETDEKAYYYPLQPNDQLSMQLFYAKQSENTEKPYYIFINTPYQLLDSTVQVLNDQFGIISLVVLVVGILAAMILSRWLSDPIITMSYEAQKLGRGRKDVYFKKSGFSEMNALADTLNFAMQEISKNDNLRIELLANISHDIRTPLTMISAYAQMIQDISGDNKELRQQHLEVIINEVESLNRLLKDMMTLSQVSSSSSRLAVEIFDVVALIEEVLESFTAMALNDKINIIFEKEVNQLVEADKIKLRQVLVNYISNAIHHVGEDRQVIIRVIEIEQTGFVRIEVIDHGKGILADELDKVWERYYRGEGKLYRSLQGSGLGLAICKEICQRGNYPYGVLSEVNQGSTFFVEVPIASNQ